MGLFNSSPGRKKAIGFIKGMNKTIKEQRKIFKDSSVPMIERGRARTIANFLKFKKVDFARFYKRLKKRKLSEEETIQALDKEERKIRSEAAKYGIGIER